MIILDCQGRRRQVQADPRTTGIAWIRAYGDWHIKHDRNDWMDSIVLQTGHLWEAVMGAVYERLERLGVPMSAPVVLLPCGELQNVPLHAAWRLVDGKRRPFLMDYSVSYAPSMALLAVSRDRANHRRRAERSLVLVHDPTDDLPHAFAEGAAIHDRFPEGRRAVYGTNLSLVALWSDLRQASYIHFACHATFATEPDLAALYLGCMTPMTVTDIRDFVHLERARLVTLSACETGLGAFFELANETTGLVEALFRAGSSTIIASLWAVDDLATFLIMEELYRQLFDVGVEPPEALCAAQRWMLEAPRAELDARLERAQVRLSKQSPDRVRTIPERRLDEARSSLRDFLLASEGGRDKPEYEGYAHPYYWAAFRCVGV